ncbi:MAG: sulfurtransferase complex subunit TusB [Betaproteobacteria bacterium]|nr:MAG: sulfurtransferase complex subunit TusB [Betaproteobacteria bacterium]
MLHIVNKSPLERSALDSCLAAAQPGAAVLLIEDGVYAATRGHAGEGKLRAASAHLQIYVLAPDLEARGMAQSLADGVKPIDYAGFVELVAQHRNCQSWL